MGYGVQRFVGPIDPNLICGICSSVLENAVLTPCGHSFCSGCVKTWLSRPGTETCPECRSRVTHDNVKPVHSLRNLINGFEVECENCCRGCKVILKLDRLKQHLDTCAYSPVVCAGCSKSVNRFELASHQIRCEGIAAAVRDDDDLESSQRLHTMRFTTTMAASDVNELLSKIASLEFQLKTLKRDLQIAESKNRVLEREYRKTKDELDQKKNELADVNYHEFIDNHYDYGYSPQSIAKLSFLIARFLLKKPTYVDRDKMFNAIRRCYDQYARCGTQYEHDVHMLVATAFASNWFTENHRQTLQYWLQCISRHRQVTTAGKYTANIRNELNIR